MSAMEHFHKGEEHFRNGQFGDAIAEFSETINKMPGNINAYISRAHAYRENREIDKAVPDIEKALEIYPNNANAKGFLANALKMQLAKNQFVGGVYWDNHDQVIRDMDKLIKSDPNYAQAYYIRGLMTHRKKGDKVGALEYYKAAVKYDPGNEEYAKMLGMAYAEVGEMFVHDNDIDGGIEYFDKALEIDPNNEMALKARSVACGFKRGIKRMLAGLETERRTERYTETAYDAGGDYGGSVKSYGDNFDDYDPSCIKMADIHGNINEVGGSIKLYDNNNNHIGYVEDGEIMDIHFNRIGSVDEDGRIRDADQSQVGSVDEDGKVRDDDQHHIASSKNLYLGAAHLLFSRYR